MGNSHLSFVFDSQDVKGADKLMLLAIADYCDEHGGCYPSYGKLASKCSVERRTAIATCKRLENAGHIYIDVKAGYETEKGNTNRFYLLKWRKAQGMDNSKFLTQNNTPTGDVDNTPTGDVDNTPTGDVDNTQSQVVSQVVSQEKDISPNADDTIKNKQTDELKNYVATEYFGFTDTTTITTANWKRISKCLKQILNIHDANQTICTIKHLKGFPNHYRTHNKGASLPLNNGMELHYGKYYDCEKTKRAHSTPKPILELTPEQASMDWRELLKLGATS